MALVGNYHPRGTYFIFVKINTPDFHNYNILYEAVENTFSEAVMDNRLWAIASVWLTNNRLLTEK